VELLEEFEKDKNPETPTPVPIPKRIIIKKNKKF
jgi:hypothetical protein